MAAPEISFALTLDEMDADPDRLDMLTIQLMQELQDLGVDTVERPTGASPPEGAKGDPVTFGALAFVVAPVILTSLVNFLQSWTLRGEGRTVRIKTATGVEVEFIPKKRLSEMEILALVDQLTFREAEAHQSRPEDSLRGRSGIAALPDQYVDFSLNIDPNGRAVASSPIAGEAEAEIPLVVPSRIEEALKLIEARHTNYELLYEVGRIFYDWLFPGPIHTHFLQTEAVARRENLKLRLRLRIEPDNLASLPLEFFYREADGTFMAINPDTVISRYLNLPLPPGRVRRRAGPLHLLVIIADPVDRTRLPPDEWETVLEGALGVLSASRQITIHIVTRATRREIRSALLQQKPDIVQFIGHGIYKRGKGYLAFVDEDTGGTWRLDDEGFANLFLGYDDNLGLISLAACESGRSENPQKFVGLAPKLVQRGVPAVLSMQYQVYIDTVKIFLEEFYTAVAARKPIDWAAQAARNAMALEFGLDNREFATPVLYMRAPDGNVF